MHQTIHQRKREILEQIAHSRLSIIEQGESVSAHTHGLMRGVTSMGTALRTRTGRWAMGGGAVVVGLLFACTAVHIMRRPTAAAASLTSMVVKYALITLSGTLGAAVKQAALPAIKHGVEVGVNRLLKKFF